MCPRQVISDANTLLKWFQEYIRLSISSLLFDLNFDLFLGLTKANRILSKSIVSHWSTIIVLQRGKLNEWPFLHQKLCDK